MTNLQSFVDKLSNTLADIFEDLTIQANARQCLDMFVDTAIRICTVVLIISIVLTVGPSIESRFFGVYYDWKASNFVAVDNTWKFDVHASKTWYKDQCLFVQNQAIDARAVVNGTNTPVTGTMKFLTSELVENPQNRQKEYFGVWQFVPNGKVPAGSIIKGSIKHQCHMLWVSTTVFGPFTITIN